MSNNSAMGSKTSPYICAYCVVLENARMAKLMLVKRADIDNHVINVRSLAMKTLGSVTADSKDCIVNPQKDMHPPLLCQMGDAVAAEEEDALGESFLRITIFLSIAPDSTSLLDVLSPKPAA